MKLLALAPWQIDALCGGKQERGENGLFEELLPHVVQARQAQGRLEQRLALLRHSEALRLDAAWYDGKLPEKLSDIALPLPVDPFTGKPFVYRREGPIAHLSGRPPRGEEKNPVYNIRYEVRIRK
jgi:hypothetical protein